MRCYLRILDLLSERIIGANPADIPVDSVDDVKIHSFNSNTYPKDQFEQCKLDDSLPIRPNTVANWY
jgi:hypothetical protein